MQITILGNNSAIPAHGRHPTSQVISTETGDIMVDCGEGTQLQMQAYGIRRKKLSYIFISHLHGDHYFGLPGLLNSMSLHGRTLPVHLFGPKQLKDILDSIFSAGDSILTYPLLFHPLPENGLQTLVHTAALEITCFPVEHRIACHGCLITTYDTKRKLLPEACHAYGIPPVFFRNLVAGEDYLFPDGRVVKNEWVTLPAPNPKKYAYAADTRYTSAFLDHIQGADLLYHEATYLKNEEEKAYLRYHSTARQAADIAQRAGVKKLLLGHFSSKYPDTAVFREEAREIFPNAFIAEEGVTYEI